MEKSLCGQGLNGGLEGGDSGGGEMWLDFGGILKIQTRGFAERWDVRG